MHMPRPCILHFFLGFWSWDGIVTLSLANNTTTIFLTSPADPAFVGYTEISAGNWSSFFCPSSETFVQTSGGQDGAYCSTSTSGTSFLQTLQGGGFCTSNSHVLYVGLTSSCSSVCTTITIYDDLSRLSSNEMIACDVTDATLFRTVDTVEILTASTDENSATIPPARTYGGAAPLSAQ